MPFSLGISLRQETDSTLFNEKFVEQSHEPVEQVKQPVKYVSDSATAATSECFLFGEVNED